MNTDVHWTIGMQTRIAGSLILAAMFPAVGAEETQSYTVLLPHPWLHKVHHEMDLIEIRHQHHH